MLKLPFVFVALALSSSMLSWAAPTPTDSGAGHQSNRQNRNARRPQNQNRNQTLNRTGTIRGFGDFTITNETGTPVLRHGNEYYVEDFNSPYPNRVNEQIRRPDVIVAARARREAARAREQEVAQARQEAREAAFQARQEALAQRSAYKASRAAHLAQRQDRIVRPPIRRIEKIVLDGRTPLPPGGIVKIRSSQASTSPSNEEEQDPNSWPRILTTIQPARNNSSSDDEEEEINHVDGEDSDQEWEYYHPDLFVAEESSTGTSGSDVSDKGSKSSDQTKSEDSSPSSSASSSGSEGRHDVAVARREGKQPIQEEASSSRKQE
jgi:hypothetical protein